MKLTETNFPSGKQICPSWNNYWKK
jgi:hypothetical protein